MASTVKTTCPVCGDVEYPSTRFRVTRCNLPDRSYYEFRCDRCGDDIRKPATPEIIDALHRGGVPIEAWHIPLEALEDHAGDAFTRDDQLDWHLALQRMDIAATLAALPRPAPRRHTTADGDIDA